MGPSYVEAGGGARLYYSSSRSAAQGGAVPGDIFVSRMAADGTFGPGELVAELSDPTANEIQPNVRKDGQEVVFSSNRSGGQGSQDIWVATRENGGEAWSQPVNLGTNINTTASESRPSLSWDGETLYLASAGSRRTRRRLHHDQIQDVESLNRRGGARVARHGSRHPPVCLGQKPGPAP